LDQMDLAVKMVLTEPRAERDLEVKPDLLEILVKRVNLVFLVCLDTLDVLVKRVQEDPKAPLDDLD